MYVPETLPIILTLCLMLLPAYTAPAYTFMLKISGIISITMPMPIIVTVYTVSTSVYIQHIMFIVCTILVCILYSGKVWWAECLANLLFSSIWQKKVWRMNRLAKGLSMVTTNFGWF